MKTFEQLITLWRDTADETRITAEKLDDGSIVRESLIEQAGIYDRCASRLEDAMREQSARTRKTTAADPGVSPWDDCEIRYRVRSRGAAQDLTINPAFPLGWALLRAEPVGLSLHSNVDGYDLVFQVAGEVSDRDGVIVRTLLERLGLL